MPGTGTRVPLSPFLPWGLRGMPVNYETGLPGRRWGLLRGKGDQVQVANKRRAFLVDGRFQSSIIAPIGTVGVVLAFARLPFPGGHMPNEVISYIEMCRREGVSLQRGMNFHLSGGHSVILMSVRSNAPYQDSIEDNGATLIYEGHDQPRSANNPNPKSVDQLASTPNGTLTQNGRFHQAAQRYKTGESEPELVRVYEKIRQGIWTYNGLFRLDDSWQEHDGKRQVFKFKLAAIEDELPPNTNPLQESQRRRIIPTSVKLQVWKRDGGKCAICGAVDELHFDHIIPFSKGGTSLKADNIQLLCARHNLEKHDKIQ